jgi:hypothetical protein
MDVRLREETSALVPVMPGMLGGPAWVALPVVAGPLEACLVNAALAPGTSAAMLGAEVLGIELGTDPILPLAGSVLLLLLDSGGACEVPGGTAPGAAEDE